MRVQLIAEPARGFGRDALTVSIQQPFFGGKGHHRGFEAESGEGLGFPPLEFFEWAPCHPRHARPIGVMTCEQLSQRVAE